MATILHIEDDPRNRLLVRKLLSAAGYKVVEAESGIEAIGLAKTCSPDLVLVDINIPGLDGYEVILRLRGIPDLRQVPIVTITAEGERQTSLAVGADGFLAKPIDARSFAKTIGQYLGGHREARGERSADRLRERSHIIVSRLEEKVLALSKANQRLEDMARLRREFLRNTSHELATPLTPIIGYLRLLLNEELGPVSEQQIRALTSMEVSMHRLRAVVDNLLDVSALESGRMHVLGRSYDFGQMCRDAVQESQPLFENRGISLRLAIPDEELDGFGDADKLKRAVIHLLDNAAKFSGEGEEVGIEVGQLRDAKGMLRYFCAIADNGPGIDPAHQKRIFEPFFQADGSPTRAYEGVGLGLAFVERVAQLSEGSVRVLSPPTETVAGRNYRGSLFEITVPAGAHT